jgi:hypothetical protein
MFSENDTQWNELPVSLFTEIFWNLDCLLQDEVALKVKCVSNSYYIQIFYAVHLTASHVKSYLYDFWSLIQITCTGEWILGK